MPIKSTRKLILSQPAVAVALIVAFLLVVGSLFISAVATREVSAASRRSFVAQQSLVAINRLLAMVSEAETGQRGYLLTRDEKYLEPYHNARAQLPDEFRQLRGLMEGRPEQTSKLNQIQTLTAAKLNELAQVLKSLHDRGLSSALGILETDEGWRLMKDIRQSLEALQRDQLSELTRTSNLASSRVEKVQQLNLGLMMVAVALAGVGALLLVRRMHDLETLITVCSWTRRVKWEGRWVSFEDYLQRRFNLQFTHGISEEAAEKFRRELEAEPSPDELDARDR